MIDTKMKPAMRKPLMHPQIAVVDAGGNNFRVAFYGQNPMGNLQQIKSHARRVRCKLGRDISQQSKKLHRRNLNKAMKTVASFDRDINHYRITDKNTFMYMTGAFRAVQSTAQGQQDIAAIRKANSDRPAMVLAETEQAILVGEAIKLELPSSLRNYQGQRCAMAFADIGGHDIMLGVVTPTGEIERTVCIPYGFHPLDKASGGDLERAREILSDILRHHFQDAHYDTLALVGRSARALGDVVCRSMPRVLEDTDIDDRLAYAATLKEKDFLSHNRGRVQGCADSLPLTTIMAQSIVECFGTGKLIFIETSIRDVIAHQIHRLNTGGSMHAPPGLERLFFHLTP